MRPLQPLVGHHAFEHRIARDVPRGRVTDEQRSIMIRGL
jgi:hypothetical protein